MSVTMEGVESTVTISDPTGEPVTVRPSKGRAKVAPEHVAVVLAHFPGATVASEETSEPSGSGDSGPDPDTGSGQ